MSLLTDLAFSSNPLSLREKEILKEVASGSSNQEIAETLFLSHGTVRNYMSSILIKLSASNRTDAVRIAQEQGWI